MCDSIKNWLKNDLTNSNVLSSLNTHCDTILKQVQDDVLYRLKPTIATSLEIASELRGLLKAKKMFNNSISSLGFHLGSLEDVIRHLQEISALIERLYLEIVQGKKDTKILIRFLNNLCIEIAEEPIDNATEKNKDLFKDISKVYT